MSIFGNSEPRSKSITELRRLNHSSVVSIDYRDRSMDKDSDLLEDLPDAIEQGYQHGYSEGLEKAIAEVEAIKQEQSARVMSSVEALTKAVLELKQAQRELLAEIQTSVPNLAFELLENILARELELTKNPGRDAVIRALSLDDSMASARIRLNPEDLRIIGDLADVVGTREVELIEDPTIESGGAVAEIGDSVYDARLSTALERIHQVMVGSSQKKEVQ